MNNDLTSLLSKPIWQMTGEDFLQLHPYAESGLSTTSNAQIKYAYGIHELSRYIGCCESTIYDLKKKGVLEDAIISRVGRKIVFDAEIARILASE